MYTYFISYDLLTPGKEYSELHKHLKTYSRWAKPLESVWLIKSDLGAASLRDAIKLHIDANDKLLVINVSNKTSAWRNLPDNVSAWIKTNL